MNNQHNIQLRVAGRGGWISMFQGESQGRALERMLPMLNRDGYRVAFIVPDKFNFLKKVLNILILIMTLGFYSQTEGLIIIGEKIVGMNGKK